MNEEDTFLFSLSQDLLRPGRDDAIKIVPVHGIKWERIEDAATAWTPARRERDKIRMGAHESEELRPA